MSFFVCGVCVCACVYVLVCMLVCLERVVKQNVRRTEYHTRGRMWNMCVIFGTPSEKWHCVSFSVHRPKNGTLVPKTVRHFKRYAVALFLAFRTFLREKRYAVRLHGTQRTLSKRTTVPFQNVRCTLFGTPYAFQSQLLYRLSPHTKSINRTHVPFLVREAVFGMHILYFVCVRLMVRCTVFRTRVLYFA